MMIQKTTINTNTANSIPPLGRSSSSPLAKRARIGTVTDEAIILNETGIFNLQNGKEDEAEICFALALDRLDANRTINQSISTSLKSTAADHANNSAKASFTLATSSSGELQFNNINLNHHEAVDQQKQQKGKQSYIYQRNEYDEGMYEYTEALPIRNRSSLSLRSTKLLYNVAQTYVHRRQYGAAKESFEAALQHIVLMQQDKDENDASAFSVDEEITSQSLDATQVKLQIYHNIGHCLYRLGESEEAMIFYSLALHEAQGMTVVNELDIAKAQNALAVLMFHSDHCENSECMNLFHCSLRVYQRTYGFMSKKVATILNNIGRVHYLNNEYAEAVECYGEALIIRRELLGYDSVDLAATICNIGQAYHQQKEYDSALLHYTEFITLAQQHFGGLEHRDVAITLRCIAEVYHEQNKYDEAKPYYEKALQIGRKAVGDAHPEVASTLNKLGNLHFELGEMDVALKYYIEGLEIEQTFLNPYHPQKIVTLCNMAQIHRNQGNYSAALLTHVEIHTIQVKLFGPKNIEVANTLTNMGFMQFHLKAYKSSFDLYKESLRIQRYHFDNADSLEIASTLSSMGLVAFNMGIFGTALECFRESLRIRKNILGNDHKDLAILWYNIATIYLEQGEDDEAIKLYKEALRLERKVNTNKTSNYSQQQDVVMTLQHIGLVHQRRGEIDEALEYFNQALEIEMMKEHTVNGNYISVARLLNLVGNVNLQKGNTGKLMVLYSTASRIYKMNAAATSSDDKASSSSEDGLLIAGHSFYGFSKLHPPCAPVA